MLKKTIGMGGFTLAEVLITLGIIGVVAAMTMPTLINSTQGAQYKTAFKKSLTVLSQAVVMNIALNDYDLSQVVAGENYEDTADDATGTPGAQTLYDLFSNRLNIVRTANTSEFQGAVGTATEYIIVSNKDKADYTAFATNHSATGGTNKFPALDAPADPADGSDVKWPANLTMLFMNDGITFIFDNEQSNCMAENTSLGLTDNYCFGFIDVNGQKAPNRVVQCDGTGIQGGTSGNAGDDDYTCTVSSPTDIYPIAMYDQSVIPASAAARAILYNK